MRYGDQLNRVTFQNASKPLDQNDYKREFEKLELKYQSEKRKVKELEAAIKDKQFRKTKADAFFKRLCSMDGPVSEFPHALWMSLCDGLVVYSPDDIRVLFKNGEEIVIDY